MTRLGRAASLAVALVVCAAAASTAKELPARIAAPAPFPAIVAQAPTISFVAPGISQGDYELLTADGPISVHVVAVAPHRGDLHLAATLASDRLVSQAETVSSMARRTGAVAGINGDYFDIDNTNQPLNVLVRNGKLLRTPRRRYALAIGRDGTPRFAEFAFSGTLQVNGTNVGLDGVNEYPPPKGGTAIITPEFGSVGPQANLTLVALTPLDGAPPFARYRVASIADNGATQPPGYYLAIGVNAYGSAGVPNEGDLVAATGDFAGGDLAAIATAVGGGPLILHGGAWFDDPDGPGGGEFLTRIPSSGAAIAPDGTLFLIVVDGRQPDVSIGVTRRQFAALMRAFGATEGIAFDGGGSSTLVARDLGDVAARVQNSPSDGRERPVADGVFVYSDAPVGAPSRVVARPAAIRAMPGAVVPLRLAVVDPAGHAAAPSGTIRARVEPASLGSYADGLFVARAAGTGTVRLSDGKLSGSVPVAISERPARLEIVPNAPNLESGGRVQFVVRAFDADGYAVALPARLAWSATAGTIDASGSYVAGAVDATVSVRAGAASAVERVSVGHHEAPLPVGAHATFSTSPKGGPGGLALGVPCPTCLSLQYDFSGGERAVYADVDTPLPAGALGVAFDVNGDGSGALVRVAFVNAINEKVLLTAATASFGGWRHVVVRLPRGFAQPARLGSIYVLDGIGASRVQTSGSIAIRDVRVLVPGNGGAPAAPGSPRLRR